MTKIPEDSHTTVERKCICQLCICGHHRCPPMDGFRIGTDAVSGQRTEYGSKYGAEKRTRQLRVKAVVPPGDHYQVGTGEGAMASETTQAADYRYHRGQKSATSFRPEEQYQSPGTDRPFSAKTTNATDFTGAAGARARPFIPPESAIQTDQPFIEGTSTQRADFTGRAAKPVHSTKPDQVAFHSAEPFTAISGYQADYQSTVAAQRVQAVRRRSITRLSDAPFQSATEHRDQFKGKQQQDRAVQRRQPGEEYQPSSAPFQSETTYSSGFLAHRAGRAKAIRPPADQSHIDGEQFQSETTYSSGFVAHRAGDEQPAAQLQTVQVVRKRFDRLLIKAISVASNFNRKRHIAANLFDRKWREFVRPNWDKSYQLEGDFNGHRYYKRVRHDQPAEKPSTLTEVAS